VECQQGDSVGCAAIVEANNDLAPMGLGAEMPETVWLIRWDVGHLSSYVEGVWLWVATLNELDAYKLMAMFYGDLLRAHPGWTIGPVHRVTVEEARAIEPLFSVTTGLTIRDAQFNELQRIYLR
jgi:hypothetical protein